MRHLLRGLIVAAVIACAAPAHADATLFLGNTSTPADRQARGLAVGMSVFVIGFELEYSDTVEEFRSAAPSLRTGMANVFVQSPIALWRVQPYLTAGAGGYRERLGTESETNVVVNTGGGVKISVLGPVRARVDYRILKLSGHPLHSRSTRLYAGVNLAF